MSADNCGREQINATGFLDRLTGGEAEAWEMMLKYARVQMIYLLRRRPIPYELDHYEDAVDEYTSQAFEVIIRNLNQYAGRGPLSAYLDTIIRNATADRNYKNALTAVRRLLQAIGKLPIECQSELRRLIRRYPPRECEMLLKYLEGQSPQVSDRQIRHRWRLACSNLLSDDAFRHWLDELASQGISQAKTVLAWQAMSKGPASLDESRLNAEGDEQEMRAEISSDPDMPLVGTSTPSNIRPVESQVLASVEDELEHQALLHCLEKLRQRSERQYEAIWRRFYSAESDEQIIQALPGGQVATVRKWRERSLKNLRDCMSRELEAM